MPLTKLSSLQSPGLSSLSSLSSLKVGPPVVRGALRELGPYESEEEESMASRVLQGGMSALAYVGSQFDAIAGRRVRAGIALAQGSKKPGLVQELFTIPVLTDAIGFTDPKNAVTGKDITGWDDDKRYIDDVTNFAAEVLLDPTTYMTGGLTGIFGASTKAGKLVRAAGVADDVARAMSRKAGRYIGRREAMARFTLRDISLPDMVSNAAAKADIEKRLDDAAKGMGYDSFKAAQESAEGGQKMQAAWGFTYKPMTSTPQYVIEGGERFAKVQANLDKIGEWARTGPGYATKNPLLRIWDMKFNKDVREASTKVGQEEATRMSKGTQRAHYRRTRFYNTFAMRARELGIDDPQFQGDLWAAVEKQVRNRIGSEGVLDNETIQALAHVEHRDLDEVVNHLFPVHERTTSWKPAGRAVTVGDNAVIKGIPDFKPRLVDEVRDGWVRFKGEHAYHDLSKIEAVTASEYIKSKYSRHGFTEAQIGSIRDFVKEYATEQAKDSADRLRRGHMAGVGPDALADFQSAYAARHAQHIESTIGRKMDYAKHVTPFMREQLRDRFGMTDAEIQVAEKMQRDKFGDVRELHDKVFKGFAGKGKIEDAFEAVRKSELEGNVITRPGGTSSKFEEGILDATDTSHRARAEVYKNLPGTADVPGGTTIANALSMDATVSGPDAGIWFKKADGEWDFRKTTFAERHAKIFSQLFQGDTKMADYYNTLRDSGQFKVGMAYGPLAAKMKGVRPATLVKTKAELAALREAIQADLHAYNKSYDLTKSLQELSPLHVIEQRPLFPDDPISSAMAAAAGAEEAIEGANAIHRLFGRTATQGIGKNQGVGVLEAMDYAGVGLSGKTVHHGSHARAAESLANFLRISKEEGIQDTWDIFGTQMHADDMTKYLGERQLVTKGMSKEERAAVKAKALEFEDMRSKILISFGLEKTSVSGYEKMVDRQYRTLAAKHKGPIDAEVSGALMKRARSQAARLVGEQAPSPIDRIYTKNFAKFSDESRSAYFIPMAEFNDARNAMSLKKSPALVQDVMNFADKIVNVTKSHWTTSWIPFLSRNFQTLGMMDFITNADNVLDPREWTKMAKRWKDSWDFHAGRQINGIHKIPMFKDHKWDLVSDSAGESKMRMPTAKEKDKILTDLLRAEHAAAHVAPAAGVGELLQDRNLRTSTSGVAAIDTIVGIGGNITEPTISRGVAALKRAIKRAKDEGVDWQWLNPLNVRGGFFNQGRTARSKYVFARVGEDVSSYTESLGRTATWLGQLYKGVDPLEAVARTNAAHVDYTSLSNFERQVMRRIIPFYTYQRKMIPYLMRTMIKHPGGPLVNMVRAVNYASGERAGRFTPQQLQGTLAIPLYDDDTGKVRAYLKPELPVNVLNNMFSIGGSAYETFQNTTLGWLSQSHFILKGGLELAFGKSTFQKGRDLEDMYSRIGIKDPILNQIVMTSPLGRYATYYGPGGILNDPRKSAGEKAFSYFTGNPLMHVDMDKATEEALDRALNKALSLEEGVGSTEKFYSYDDSKLSERAKALMKLRTTRDLRRMNAAREKAKQQP